MNQEVIRDFLNVPGIVGIALLSGHSEPIFYTNRPGFAQAGKNDLLHSLLQIVGTIPPEYEVLEFRFAEFGIALHQLQWHQAVLIMKEHEFDSERFMTEFAVLRSQLNATATTPISVGQTPLANALPRLQELIEAMNSLSQFTTQYLGIPVITNYWKSSRPDGEWIAQFQVARSGQISFLGESSALGQSVSAQQLATLRDWVEHFIRRCSQPVRDYATLVKQQVLSDPQKALLLP